MSDVLVKIEPPAVIFEMELKNNFQVLCELNKREKNKRKRRNRWDLFVEYLLIPFFLLLFLIFAFIFRPASNIRIRKLLLLLRRIKMDFANKLKRDQTTVYSRISFFFSLIFYSHLFKIFLIL